MSLQEEVRQMLFKRKLKMKDLANELKISVSYLYYILEGKRKAYQVRKQIEKIIEENK